MHIHVELFGIPRLIAGKKELAVDLAEGSTFRDIVRFLATRYPPMIGDVIEPDGQTLQDPNVFNLDNRVITPEEMTGTVSDGAHIVLMSILAGG